MRVLVTWGSKLGGTEGIAKLLGEVLAHEGFDVTLAPAAHVGDVTIYEAAVIGGALYANRWHRDAYRFATRHISTLQRIPVWLFSSGPLDDSADLEEIPPTRQVAVLAERIGAVQHVTFGGRLTPDAKGFPAAAMAKTRSGDFRNPERIRAWAAQISSELPNAKPREATEPSARSPWRLVAHAVVGWVLCNIALNWLQRVFSLGADPALHAITAPLVFAAVSSHYFRAHGARDPAATATAFMIIVGILDVCANTGLRLGNVDVQTQLTRSWLPLALIFFVTWATGFICSTLPWPKPQSPKSTGSHEIPKSHHASRKVSP